MKLLLGTVQFGLDYGIANQTGKPAPAEVDQILSVAASGGITCLDTAYAYGVSEEVLGATPLSRGFAVISKIPSQKRFPGKFESLVRESLRRLGRERLYGLLFHDPADCTDEGFAQMARLKELGLTERIGVSTYTPEELRTLTARYPVDLVQVPLSLFDQRLVRTGVLREVKARGTEIHVRSAFMQGLLFREPASLDPFFAPARAKLEALRARVGAGRAELLRAALGYMAALPEVDKIVVGAERAEQLREILAAYQTRTEIDFSPYAVEDANVLNPQVWPKKS